MHFSGNNDPCKIFFRFLNRLGNLLDSVTPVPGFPVKQIKSNPKASADFNVSFEQILPAGITSRVSNISASKSTGSKLAPTGRPHNSFNRAIWICATFYSV